jgi:hypothetical protein
VLALAQLLVLALVLVLVLVTSHQLVDLIAIDFDELALQIAMAQMA